MPLVSTVVASPLGPLTLVASDAGLRAVLWPDDDPDRVPAAGTAVPVDDPGDHPVLARTAAQLDEYFAGGRRSFDLPLDPVGTEFQLSAWRALTTIPYGTTATYAEQAERLGDRNKARAVGAANARNPLSIVVPCHRVVGSDGSLTGFAGGVETKRRLLALEAGRSVDSVGSVGYLRRASAAWARRARSASFFA
jgi:methylated-DNA-[protein]-cysteine S-methyltransferase